MCAWPGYVLGLLCLLWLFALPAQAQTYQSASTTFSWVDTATHTRIGYNTTPYKFNGGGGCGTTPPVIDDTLSDLIPIGFSFVYGTTGYTQLRIQTNGRLQFNNTTCGAGTTNIGPPQTYPYGYPNASMNNTMKVFGVDLDPTNKVDSSTYPTTCNGHANCHIKWASTGTAPNRQFVVTWFHVPEWVTASNTSGSFDLQVILNEDGSFVYQYGTITHGGTGTAQVGWQLTTTDFAVLSFGASVEPPPNTAIVFFKPSAVANYRFDEGAWLSGVAGQVLDTTANARHGMAVGTAQTTSDGYVCRGANIPANTSGAAVDAVQTGVNVGTASLNLLGTGTVTFWYKSTSAWSGVAAQLLDATSVSGQWFYLTKKAGGTLYFGVTDSTGTFRSVETPVQAFAANTWVHIAVSWNFNGLAAANSDQLKIFVNGGTPTTASFTSTGTVTTQAGLLYFGDNPIGIADANGSVNSANGVIDEVKVYNSALSTAQVGADKVSTHACPSFNIHHLEIQSSGSGLTCAASPITIRACQDATCSVLYTGGVSGTLTATGTPVVIPDGSSGGSPGSGFAIGAGSSSTVKYIQLASAGSVVLGIAGINPTAPNSTTCNFGSPACTFTANTAGFIFSNASTGGSYTIPAQVSGTATAANAIYLRAVQALTTNPAVCTPAIISQSNVPVTLGYTCTDPATCQAGNLLTINSTAVPAGGGSVNLNFDANGSAPITVRYDDVGRITVNSSKTVTPFGGATPVNLTGSSNSFVVAPASFAVTPAGPFVAGSPFSVTVAAKNALGGTTQNFGKESSTENVTLDRTLTAPAGGNNPALAGTTTLTDAAFQTGNGVASTSAVQWGEVGDIAITATLASGSYLGSGLTATGSGTAGPFKPAYFTTAFDTAQPCTSFTYSGQPFRIKVTAINAAGVATQNYTGSHAKAVTLGSDGASACTPTTTGFSNNTLAAADFTAAHASTPGAASTAPVTNTAAPLPISHVQALGVPATVVVCAKDADGVNSHGHAQASLAVRNGVLRLDNAYGSELLPIHVPVRALYCHAANATGCTEWRVNTDDSCTVLTPQALAIGNVTIPVGSSLTFSTPPTGVAGVPSVTLAGGITNLRITPSTRGVGSADVILNLGGAIGMASCVTLSSSVGGAAPSPTLPYLAGNWCGSAYDKAPVVRIKLGSPKAPYIYLRERY
ncbi:MAG: LamG domain-containing protein [Rhodocyclaceae bacterium]|nr:LamG domain-containing protein [Rhodocyclaceae bacterium]